MSTVSKAELFISATGSLFDKVTPNLRQVIVTIEDHALCLNFYYDLPPSEEEEELVSLAHTEFVSDFPPPNNTTDCRIIVLPYPAKSIDKTGTGMCVYARYEPSFEPV